MVMFKFQVLSIVEMNYVVLLLYKDSVVIPYIKGSIVHESGKHWQIMPYP